MPHIVMFTSPEGKKGYHHCEELEEALRFVERLRNTEGVTDAQVFRMEEVVIEFKQYFKVEVAGVHAEGHVPEGEHPDDALAPPAPVPVMGTPPGSRPDAPAEGRPAFSIFSK